MNDLDLIRVVDVDYIKDYTMDLKFSNGETRRVNFLPLLKGNKREELKDMNKFIQFGLNHWTLEWYNGIDFAPDYLFKQGVKHMEALDRMPFVAKKKIFERLAEIADSSCLSQKDREKYEESQKAVDDWYSGMYGAWEEGMEKGELNGKNKEKISIAKKMLSANVPDFQIMQFTGLTKEQIDSLKS